LRKATKSHGGRSEKEANLSKSIWFVPIFWTNPLISGKLSQGAIGRKLNFHRAYISGIEHGKRNPTLATIQKLADALGVSADELLK